HQSGKKTQRAVGTQHDAARVLSQIQVKIIDDHARQQRLTCAHGFLHQASIDKLTSASNFVALIGYNQVLLDSGAGPRIAEDAMRGNAAQVPPELFQSPRRRRQFLNSRHGNRHLKTTRRAYASTLASTNTSPAPETTPAPAPSGLPRCDLRRSESPRHGFPASSRGRR